MVLRGKIISKLVFIALLGSALLAMPTLASPIFMVNHGAPMVRTPLWVSVPQTTTYSNAVSICAAYGGRLCYRNKYCPYGHAGGENLYGGSTKGGDNWAAVNDQVNNWVQVGGGGSWATCLLHTEIGGGGYGLPSWSTSSTAQTFRNWVLCCFQ